MLLGKGHSDRFLTDPELCETVEAAIATLPIDGKRVLILIPDGTRTMPMRAG